MWKWMSRDDQKNVSSGGLHFDQDPEEDGRGEMNKMWWVCWDEMGMVGGGTFPQVCRSFWMEGLCMMLVCQVFIMELAQGT